MLSGLGSGSPRTPRTTNAWPGVAEELCRFALLALTILVAATQAEAGEAALFGEPVVKTQHQVRINGQTLRYSAETGRVAIRNAETGEPHGYMFYIAYRKASTGQRRPITFVWNGGPGSNSALLHFEAAGPRRLDGDRLVDNQDTWLTATDLVFVDPIGTGFSRPSKPEYAEQFYGTLGDVASVTEFVRAWRLLHAAEAAPILLAGESWGAGRAGSVGYALLKRGIPVRALVLISGGTGLNRETGSAALNRALRTVDRSATALFHSRLPADLGNSAAKTRALAEDWVRKVYAPALEQIDALNDPERDAVVEGLERFSGMPTGLINRESLVIAPRAYREGLLQYSGNVLDIFDMRLLRERQSGQPNSGSASRRQLIMSYLRDDLGYRTDLPYVGIEPLEEAYAAGGTYPPSVNARWNYATAEVTPEEMEAAFQAAVKHGGGPPQLGPPLPSAAEAVVLDPRLVVLVAAGRFDSLNSCAANDEIAAQLEGDLKNAYAFKCYEGGHMMYRDEQARTDLARDLRELAEAAVAQTVFIAGDSTASEYGPERYPRMGWGQVLGDFYGEGINVVDLAISGRSARSYIDEGLFAELEKQLDQGDILLIQFGHNDQKAHSPERYAPADTAFKNYLRQYIDMARDKGANPVLLTSIVRRKFEDGKLKPTHGQYPQAVRDLAAETGVGLIDMTHLSRQFVSRLGEQESKAIYLHSEGADGPIEDNTHFSERGAYAMAAMVEQGLDTLQIVPHELPSPTFFRVEKDGTGDVSRIQDAIDKLDGSDAPAVILVGAGEFDEKLYITRDNITFVGRGRDSTTIKTTELRANWRETHDDDWGDATINIKASDLTFMRLSVLNDYGILYGDNSHQFALRLMEGTRIITEDSTFITGGADTVSLWNKQDGMYYHRRAWFEGYTDFVCPRGWSYITDSAFFSRGGAAAIWHDGARDETQKLVIKNSSFDGVEDFILGRRHYDAQFYLINNRYSDTLADIPIFRVTYQDVSRNRPNLWGDRYYFFGSVKQGEAFTWLQDNISPEMAELTPVQTFNGKWDPEAGLARIKAQIALYETKEIVP